MSFERLVSADMKEPSVAGYRRQYRRRMETVALALAGLLSATPVFAQGVDELYEREPADKTWGQRLAETVGFDGFSKSYALTIGISDYEGGYADLPTTNDARRMAQFLIDEAGFDHVHLLTEDKVTKARVAELMSEEFPNLLNADDRFLFYWSGHGDTRAVAVGDGKAGYLPLADTPPERWSRMIAMEDVQRWNRFLPARQSLFLLDACFGGLAGIVPKSSSLRRHRIEQLSQPGHHIMSAGTENEQTIASDQWGGSLFTTALLDGLSGKADAATGFERDGIVSLSELKSYVQERMLFERQLVSWASQITPQVRDLGTSSGEFFFLAKHAPRLFQSDTGDGRAGTQTMGREPTTPDVGDKDIAQAAVLRQGPEIPAVLPAEPGSTFRDCGRCPLMVVIPSGTFLMGSMDDEEWRDSDEGPHFSVTFGRPFAIGKYEVTFKEWNACVDAGECRHRPDDHGWGTGDRPVINVSWEDAQSYLGWLNRLTNETYRLPSEAEWEYAARADEETRYSFGEKIGKNKANCRDSHCDDNFAKTSPVGSFPPNAFGLHDVHGNVWEWTADSWQAGYWETPSDGSSWNSSEETKRVVRGGSWSSGSEDLRSANRWANYPSNRLNHIGFRVARSLIP